MNSHEAKQILSLLSAIFPSAQLADDSVLVWFSTLSELDYEASMGAVNLARRSLDRFPTHKWFIDTAIGERRRLIASTPRPELPEMTTPDPEVAAKHMAEIREHLDRQRAKSRAALAPEPTVGVNRQSLRTQVPRPDEDYFKSKGHIE